MARATMAGEAALECGKSFGKTMEIVGAAAALDAPFELGVETP